MMKADLKKRLDRLQGLVEQNGTSVMLMQFKNAAMMHFLNGGDEALVEFLERKEKELLDESGNWI